MMQRSKLTHMNSRPVARLVGLGLFLAFFGLGLGGCASVQMPAPQASAVNVEKLQAAKLTPVKTGKFELAPGKNPELDRSVGGLRGSTLTAKSGSYAQQLRDEIVVELKSAGLYSESSDTIIGAKLTDSFVDAAIGTGSARLAAQFSVTRAGKIRYEKELSVASQWESSFVGAVALPMAISQYSALYKSLVGKLIDDPDFRAAMSP